MGQWIVTVAGIAVLAMLCDVILPEGQTRKYIKTVIGVIVTLVMIQPIVGFVGETFTASDVNRGNYSEVSVQQSYLDMVDDKQLQVKISLAQDVLSAQGIYVEVNELDKNSKKLVLKPNTEYSVKNESIINKTFDTYFKDYKITIKWNR